MPNEAEKFGLPRVIIDFRTKSTTAIARSARGIGVMILNNESTNVSKFYKISDSTDIPDEGLTAKNVDLIKKALLGIPLRILVYTLPMADVVPGEGTLLNQADVLKKLHNIKWNYICHPTGTAQDQEDTERCACSSRQEQYEECVIHCVPSVSRPCRESPLSRRVSRKRR